MTPTNGSEDPAHGSTAWDFAVEVVRAVRDIFNNPIVAVGAMVLVLLLLGKVAAPEFGEMAGDILRAWRCQP